MPAYGASALVEYRHAAGSQALIARLLQLLTLLLILSGMAACAGPLDPSALQRMKHVVSDIEADRLTSADTAYAIISLPDEYRDLSAGGEIVVSRESGFFEVVFFTRRGVVDDYEGVIFTADPPLRADPLGGVLRQGRVASP